MNKSIAFIILLTSILLLSCNNIPETEEDLKEYIVDYVWELNNEDYNYEETYRLYFNDDYSCTMIYPDENNWRSLDTIKGEYSIIKAEIIYMDEYGDFEPTEMKLLIIAPELGFFDTRKLNASRSRTALYFDSKSETLCQYFQPRRTYDKNKQGPIGPKIYYSYLRKINK